MTPYSLPALIALTFKVLLLAYVVIKSPIKNQNTKLYFALLSFLSAHNLVEVGILNYFYVYGLDSFLTKLGLAYFVFFIPALAILLHISLRLSFGLFERPGYRLILLYIPAAILEYLLLFTDELVAGFIPFQYSILRIPGTLYFLFETFAVLCMMGSLANLCFSAIKPGLSMANKIRNRLWLLAIAPMALLTTYLIVCNHFGWTKLTSTFHIPLATTFFLLVTTYATHQYRLFDIQFYIPWSKVRKRKTAFYKRIQLMIAEIADLNTEGVESIVRRLADTLNCSVALVGGNKPVVALADGPRFLTEIPQPILHKIDYILVANEIADTLPDTYRILKNAGVAAIVPFHPHSRYACGWLLLGDSFSEQVYTPRDFKFVEQLFDRMADVFLDKLLAMRTQLADATRRIRVLERRQETLQNDMAQLGNTNQLLIKENARLLQYQPADSLSRRAQQPSSDILAPTVTVLGRDKDLFKGLRAQLPQAVHFVGIASSGFKRQQPADVLLCEIEEGGAPKLLEALNERPHTAVMLYGVGAPQWLSRHKQALLGRLIEIMPQDRTLETVAHKIRALAVLRNALYGIFEHDQPLLGQSEVFTRLMAEAKRLAALTDPVLIKTTDLQQAITLATFMHQASGGHGEFRVIRAANALQEETLDIVNVLPRTGVLMIDDISLLPEVDRAALCRAIQENSAIRLFAGTSAESTSIGDEWLAPLRPFVLVVPSLRERRIDLPLLIHYFTLQYNLQSGSVRYLRQAEVDDLMAERFPKDLAALKHTVFNSLMDTVGASAVQNLGEPGGEKTLDQHLTEFEARLIADTLKRCNGNKSQAARLLGLRPNTLHYKLERYALLTEKKFPAE